MSVTSPGLFPLVLLAISAGLGLLIGAPAEVCSQAF
jgi:hypothetical protein